VFSLEYDPFKGVFTIDNEILAGKMQVKVKEGSYCPFLRLDNQGS